MSRRATDEELAAARELAREVQREGGLSGISLNELLEAFSVRRFTDASRDRLSEALEQAGLTAEPSLHDVERGDHLTLTAAGQSTTRLMPAGWRDSVGPPSGVGGARRADQSRSERRSHGGVADHRGAVPVGGAGPEPKRWYRRPTRVAAAAALLLFLMVGVLGGDESSSTLENRGSQGLIVSDDEDRLEREAAQQRTEARRREAREARERRQRRAEARAAERRRARAAARRRARQARAARLRAAARRERQAEAAAFAAAQEAERQAAEEAASGGGGDCAAGYDPCIPSFPPDLDCADTGPVTVSGSDPHGLDADNDGVACGGD